jgi:ABC-type transport system involved in Fe-S cluster assembly fused permease/ATPase subunit
MKKVPEGFAIRFALSGLCLSKGKQDDAIALLKETMVLKKNEKDQNVVEAKNTLARVYLDRRRQGRPGGL